MGLITTITGNNVGGGKKVTVYHYTSKSGYNGITSDKTFKFKKSKPAKGHPEGVYLTTKSPEELAKSNNGFKKLGLTNLKSEYYFEFEIDEGLLKTFDGARNKFIKYIDDTIDIDRSNVSRYGKTPKKK